MTNRTLITAAAALLTLATVYGIAYIHGRTSVACDPCTASLSDLTAARRTAQQHSDSAAYYCGMRDLWRDISVAAINEIQPLPERRPYVHTQVQMEGVPGIHRRLLRPADDARAILDSIRSEVEPDTAPPARIQGVF